MEATPSDMLNINFYITILNYNILCNSTQIRPPTRNFYELINSYSLIKFASATKRQSCMTRMMEQTILSICLRLSAIL